MGRQHKSPGCYLRLRRRMSRCSRFRLSEGLVRRGDQISSFQFRSGLLSPPCSLGRGTGSVAQAQRRMEKVGGSCPLPPKPGPNPGALRCAATGCVSDTSEAASNSTSSPSGSYTWPTAPPGKAVKNLGISSSFKIIQKPATSADLPEDPQATLLESSP
jgi:hypothetical protein